MNHLKMIFVKYHLVVAGLSALISAIIYVGIVELSVLEDPPSVWLFVWIWFGIGYMENTATVEYWVRSEFRQKIIDTLISEGFEWKRSKDKGTLYMKKLKFGRRRFAILTDHTANLTLEISDRCEKMMDQHITTDMLSGGKRLVGRRLFRRKAAQATG
jgi:hypothetical protein